MALYYFAITFNFVAEITSTMEGQNRIVPSNGVPNRETTNNNPQYQVEDGYNALKRSAINFVSGMLDRYAEGSYSAYFRNGPGVFIGKLAYGIVRSIWKNERADDLPSHVVLMEHQTVLSNEHKGDYKIGVGVSVGFLRYLVHQAELVLCSRYGYEPSYNAEMIVNDTIDHLLRCGAIYDGYIKPIKPTTPPFLSHIVCANLYECVRDNSLTTDTFHDVSMVLIFASTGKLPVQLTQSEGSRQKRSFLSWNHIKISVSQRLEGKAKFSDITCRITVPKDLTPGYNDNDDDIVTLSPLDPVELCPISILLKYAQMIGQIDEFSSFDAIAEYLQNSGNRGVLKWKSGALPVICKRTEDVSIDQHQPATPEDADRIFQQMCKAAKIPEDSCLLQLHFGFIFLTDSIHPDKVKKYKTANEFAHGLNDYSIKSTMGYVRSSTVPVFKLHVEMFTSPETVPEKKLTSDSFVSPVSGNEGPIYDDCIAEYDASKNRGLSTWNERDNVLIGAPKFINRLEQNGADESFRERNLDDFKTDQQRWGFYCCLRLNDRVKFYEKYSVDHSKLNSRGLPLKRPSHGDLKASNRVHQEPSKKRSTGQLRRDEPTPQLD